jgi:hypothetical protein
LEDEELILQKFYDDHNERVNKVKAKRLKKPFNFTLGSHNCQSRNGTLISNICLQITLPFVKTSNVKTSNEKKISELTREQQVVGSWFTATIYGEYDSIEQVEEAVRDANLTKFNSYSENMYKKRIEDIKNQLEELKK